MAQTTDDAAVAVERLDDVELKADGRTLLYQLKHSISATPPPITICKSPRSGGRVRVWIDLLPSLTLSDTTFHLVAVAQSQSGSPLATSSSNLTPIAPRWLKRMVEEAQRVVDARAGSREGQSLHLMRIAWTDARHSWR